jgi:hypothetical protein
MYSCSRIHAGFSRIVIDMVDLDAPAHESIAKLKGMLDEQQRG